MNERPKIGVGILIFNHQNQILLSKRKNSHGEGSYSAPGGHLEFGENIDDCAIREVKEETNLTIENPEFFAITNDIFESENKHYVTIFMKAKYLGGIIKNMEPEKSEEWDWYEVSNLPKNLFLPLKNIIEENLYGTKLIEKEEV